MLDLLKKLYRLQKIDTGLADIEKAKEGLPQIVNDLEKELTEKKEQLENNKNTLDTAKKELSDAKFTIQDSKERIEKRKNDRYEVKNNKDYELIVSEMKYHEDLIKEKENSLDVLNQDIESAQEVYDTSAQKLEQTEKKLEDSKEQLKEKIAQTAENEKKLLEEKEQLIKEIPAQKVKLYNRIAGSKDALAVVTADNGHCGGCHTMLPSQKVSELKRANTMVQCDACSRILVVGMEE